MEVKYIKQDEVKNMKNLYAEKEILEEYFAKEEDLRICKGCDKKFIPTVSKKFCRRCWEEVQVMIL